MTSFLFYDTETTGLNSAFDQILTFAAIRTDLDLNEIEKYEITIQMRPDIVPSPGAFITHRLMPQDWAEGVCEYEGARRIHEIVNRPGTISIGYNSLSFDDEFLRFTFYRNLLDPYSHQYANGCCRMDLLPITTLYRVFKPEFMAWPKSNDGKSSLKLELMLPSLKQKFIGRAEHNELNISGMAHNAMTDVKVTLALAKCLMEERTVWKYCLDFFDKQKDRARVDNMNTPFQPSGIFKPGSQVHSSEAVRLSQTSQPIKDGYALAIMISHRFGADSMYMAPVLGIGRSYHYANQSLWLRLDRELIPSSDLLNPEELFAVRKKDGEAAIILPPLERFWNLLSEEQRASVEKNRSSVHDNPDKWLFLRKIVEYHREFKYPSVPEADLDSLLYQSPFFTKSEKREMEQFHRSSMEEKSAMVERMATSRIKSLAIRILFRNYPKENISSSIYSAYRNYMERVRCRSNEVDKKLIGFKREDRLVPEKAIEEIRQIFHNADVSDNQKLDGEQKKILEWIEEYILSI